ncbi:MAG: hypothetical protein WDN28_16510 [Chthoniobacter sp.]
MGITHSVFVAGAETAILNDKGEVLWTYPAATRDGFVLPDGHVLLALSKNKEYPGGGVVEVTRGNQIVFEYKGTQVEVNTAEALPNGRILLTEAGPNPRVLEVDRTGKIVIEVPLQAQTTDGHMQSRMTRRLENGNYLVPQVKERVVREYTPAGKIVWEYQSRALPKECSPFIAIRLPDGHTLVTQTRGTRVDEVDADGRMVWELTTADLPTPLLNHPTAAQRLPNGHTVISSYGAGENAVKLFEVTRDKQVVWTMTLPWKHGIHEFQVLDTNGTALSEPPLK